MQREKTTDTGIADSSFRSPYGCEQIYLAQLHGAICQRCPSPSHADAATMPLAGQLHRFIHGKERYFSELRKQVMALIKKRDCVAGNE